VRVTSPLLKGGVATGSRRTTAGSSSSRTAASGPAPWTEEEVVEAWAPRPRRFFSLGAAAAVGLFVEEVMALDGEDLTELPELANDLDVQMRLCRGDGGPRHYPPELLPVAVGPHDDLLLLRLDGPDAGAVYFSYDPDGYCEWHCQRVAGSFADLLRGLEG
jgi:hypothetical protein